MKADLWYPASQFKQACQSPMPNAVWDFILDQDHHLQKRWINHCGKIAWSQTTLDFAQVENVMNEEIPQIYSICGRGSRSSLRVLRPGLAVTEMAVSPLPGNPTAVLDNQADQHKRVRQLHYCFLHQRNLGEHLTGRILFYQPRETKLGNW